MAVSTITDPNKKPKNLPLQDPNNPYAPIPLIQQNSNTVPTIVPQQVKPVSAPQSTTSQLANQTLQQAAITAQKGYQSPVATQTSQLTQQLLRDPNQGYNPQQSVAKGLTEYDRNAANAIETARQGLVGASGSSLAQSGLKDLALKTAEGKSTLKNQLEQSASETARQNVLSTISAGQTTSGMEQGIQSGNFDQLLSVLSASQPELQREESAIDRGLAIAQANQNAELQTSLMELQGKIQTGQQLMSQDFEAIQNNLDREITKWTQSGNWENALNALKFKGEIDLQSQQAQQQWQTGERLATQSWSTTERVSEQDFTAAQNYLSRQLQQSIATADAEMQKWVTEKQGELQLKMQVNGMGHEESMAYLNSQLREAEATGDVGRQQLIMSYASNLKMNEMEKENGFNVAIESMRGDIEREITFGNNANAIAMQKAELEYRVNKDIQDQKLEQASLALQEKGVDVNVFQSMLSTIDDMIEKDGLNPQMKMDFVKSTMVGQGIDTSLFEKVDVASEAQQAISAEFDLMKNQYLMTHPEFVDEATGDLNKDGMLRFNQYFNKMMYGELSEEDKQKVTEAGYITDPAEIPNAMPGDKYKISTSVEIPMFGYDQYKKKGGGVLTVKIPAGEYSVLEEPIIQKNGLFGATNKYTKVYLIDANGKKIHIGSRY